MAKVLIVDDNPKNIQVLGNILSDDRYEIEFSRNGLEAVKRVEDEDFDIILLDIMMPIMDGFEACEKIKRMEGRAHIPVIFITAKADADSVSRGFALGAIDYITKPFNAIELHAKVKTQIELKKNRDLLKSFNQELELKVQERTLSLKESNEKLKALNLRLAEVEELERRRIAENLHDTVGQSLSMAFMKLSTLAPDSCENGKNTIKEVSALLNQAIEESRTITYDLSPPILYELGLIAALEWRLEQINAKQQITTRLEDNSNKLKIKKEFQVVLYRIACEMFANVIKHANASQIVVEIKEKRKSYKIFIRDNGVGFDTSKPIQSKTGGGFGLRSIMERLEAMNAKLKIDSVVGQGTKAIITIKKQK